MTRPPEDVLAELDEADELIEFATTIRNRLTLNGWTTSGAESLTELIVAERLAVTMTVYELDDDEDEE